MKKIRPPHKNALFIYYFYPHKNNEHIHVLRKLKKNNFAPLFCFLGNGVKHGTREYPL